MRYLSIILFLFLAACTPPNGWLKELSDPTVRASETEIVSIVSGKSYVIYNIQSRGGLRLHFFENGDFVSYGSYGARDEGSWSVHDGKLCTSWDPLKARTVCNGILIGKERIYLVESRPEINLGGAVVGRFPFYRLMDPRGEAIRVDH